MLVFEIVKSKWIRETTSQCEYITNRFYLHNVANFLKIIVIRTYQIYQSYKIVQIANKKGHKFKYTECFEILIED